jgi:hypothetical protein
LSPYYWWWYALSLNAKRGRASTIGSLGGQVIGSEVLKDFGDEEMERGAVDEVEVAKRLAAAVRLKKLNAD